MCAMQEVRDGEKKMHEQPGREAKMKHCRCVVSTHGGKKHPENWQQTNGGCGSESVTLESTTMQGPKALAG